MKAVPEATVTLLSSTDQTNSDFIYRLYRIDSESKEVAYAGQLNRTSSGFEWPSSMDSYFKAMGNGTQSVLYVLKAFSPGSAGMNGDYYFEAPVINRFPILNGPSTALWWALKQTAMLEAKSLRLKESALSDMLFLMDSACPSCVQRNASDSFRLLQQNAGVVAGINQVLTREGQPSLSASVLAQAPIGLAYTSPAMVGTATNLGSAQGKKVSLDVVFYDPLRSGMRLGADSWGITTPLDPTNEHEITTGLSNGKTRLDYVFEYITYGDETITAHFSTHGQSLDVRYFFNVIFNSRPPVFTEPDPTLQVFTFRANHLKKVNLALYSSDPEGEPITYSLLYAPTGAILVGSELSWNPKQEPTSQVGTDFVSFTLSDTAGNVTPVVIPVEVLEDHYPAFLTGPISPLAVTEAVPGTFVFTTEDEDGDPVEISCKSATLVACSNYLTPKNLDNTVAPPGSGFPSSLANPASTFYSGTTGLETITIPYTPTYRQTIGGNAVQTIVFTLNYPAADTTLRQVVTPMTMTVDLAVENVADPPVWNVAPGPVTSPLPIENIAITPIPGGSASDPVINPGSQVITYAIDPPSTVATPGAAANCSWITVDPVTAEITGTPPYSSAGSCKIALRAIDDLGMYTVSPSLTIAVEDVPRPVVASGVVPPQTATENTKLSFNLMPYFTDPDATASDPRETFTMTCLNCTALGINGAAMRNAGDTTAGTYFTWTPDYDVAPSGGSTLFSGIQIQVTDFGGATAVQTFDLTVNDKAAPMVVSFADGSLTVAPGIPKIVTLNAGSSGTFILRVENTPGDAASYPYTVVPTCSPGCFSMISLDSTSASGAHDFTVTVNPTYEDGYAGPTQSFRQYTLGFQIQSALISPSPNGMVAARVMTVDRPATGLSVNGDAGTGLHSFSIEGSIFYENTQSLQILSPDMENDTFTYTFETSTYPAFGTINGNTWEFNPILSFCSPGTATVVKNFQIKGTSSHGPAVSFTRTFKVTIEGTTVGGGGGCPY